MRKYKIISGEFSLVLKEASCKKAAHEAIKLHMESSHHSCLGQITMVESQKEDARFFCTQSILDELTNNLSCDTLMAGHSRRR